MILMLIKDQSLKKKDTVNIINLNTLSGMMTMVLLDHYIYLFHKQLDYINKFDKNKITMSLMIKDIQLLKNYNKIWKKIEKLMKIDFNTKTTYGDDGDKYIKTIKTYKDSINTNFCNKNGSKKIPEEKVPNKFLSIIILDSVIYAYEKDHPQTFLEECKYLKENITTKNYIEEELKSESDTDTNSDNDIDIDNEE